MERSDMAGHSKWANIEHREAAHDARLGSAQRMPNSSTNSNAGCAEEVPRESA
jgi:hypothetical protein